MTEPSEPLPDAGDPAGGLVTVRYWAAARAAAGRAEDHVAARDLAEVLAAVLALHQDEPRFGQVLGVSSFLLGEQPVASREPEQIAVAPGDVVEVLPPFAGGSADVWNRPSERFSLPTVRRRV